MWPVARRRISFRARRQGEVETETRRAGHRACGKLRQVERPRAGSPSSWFGVAQTEHVSGDVAVWNFGALAIGGADAARKQLESWTADYRHFPVCMAKTQMSFSADANANVKGAPSGYILNVHEVSLANGAGFVVAVCGDMMTMPGLPKLPSAEKINIDDNGKVSGLF
ncbi:MAG: formate--tetrahydrofolate ligase [Methyloversatilis sp.]|nr:formate--tetrahydrofolate ligase [Methyloversatilis sp.]